MPGGAPPGDEKEGGAMVGADGTRQRRSALLGAPSPSRESDPGVRRHHRLALLWEARTAESG